MDEATSRWAVVSGVSRSSQHEQVRGVRPFIPGCQPRQPPFRIFTVRWAGRAREICFWRKMNMKQLGLIFIHGIMAQRYYFSLMRGFWRNAISSNTLHKSIPVKYAEVESESNASNHTIVMLSCTEVVSVIPWQHFCCHNRAVLLSLVLNMLLCSQVQLSLRLFCLSIFLL